MKTPTLNPINFVTGTLGAGKSGYATRTAFHYLAQGKIVALNYDLIPYRARHPKTGEEWPDHPYHGAPWWRTVFDLKYAGLGRSYAPAGADRWREYQDIVARCLRFDDNSDLYDYVLPGDPEVEDRGLLVVDEGALRGNARMWSDRQSENKAAGRHKLADLQFMLHVRKLGWTMLFLTQGFTMIDNQYRQLGPVEIRLRNFQKMVLPIFNVPMSRKPRFMASHKHMEADFVMQRENFRIEKAFGHYRSAQVFHPGLELETGVRQMSELPRASFFPHPDDDDGMWFAPARRAPALSGGTARRREARKEEVFDVVV